MVFIGDLKVYGFLEYFVQMEKFFSVFYLKWQLWINVIVERVRFVQFDEWVKYFF